LSTEAIIFDDEDPGDDDVVGVGTSCREDLVRP
jgi:hypothetical protein